MPRSDTTPGTARGSRRPTTELLLDAAELLHARELTLRVLARELGEPSRRVRDAVLELLREGLVRQSGVGGPLARYTLTGTGADALAARGRFLGDVVVLFTDLVASTELIATHGELGAHDRRLRHLNLLRASVAAAGGHEVKGLGDGLMVAFADANAAVRCALAMQRSVADDADGLGLRVGLQLGPVLREGDDLHGSTVITAARLCDQAGRGDVLISREVADALSGDAAGQPFVLAPAGTRALKGLAVPIETYTVTPASLPPGHLPHHAAGVGAAPSGAVGGRTQTDR
ncbi:MAG: adenylate/guanylate cyclase domain-containing protein [Patulibacter sp.]